MEKRGGIEFSFSWLFAIIVGAFILFLAIYALTKMTGSEEKLSDVEVSKSLGISLNLIETNFGTAFSTILNFPKETRIYNRCDNSGSFGGQTIGISQKDFGKWSKTSQETTIQNRYIFSEKAIEGKNFYLFSKPFEFPFKVADLIYLTPSSEIYCFIDAPEEIKEEIQELKNHNPNLNLALEDCSESEETRKVCFEKSSCEIYVNYNEDYVKKDGEKMNFKTDALMYAAVFSTKDVYECQLKRLMQRTEQLSNIYINKEDIISKQGCSTELNQKLIELKNSAKSLQDSSNLKNLYPISKEIENINHYSACSLW